MFRLSTVVNCDKILVMDKGRVAEAGRHEDLVSDEDSIYFRLWRSQVIPTPILTSHHITVITRLSLINTNTVKL